MSDWPTENSEQDPLKPRGHVMGFVDTEAELVAALEQSMIEQERVSLFHGELGVENFEQMMDGSQWGESAEKFLAQGRLELADGHFLLSVKVHDDEDAARVAELLKHSGIHSLFHFGTLVDTQLTA